jgi:nascent polypeptide-associated complex subunit beta
MEEERLQSARAKLAEKFGNAMKTGGKGSMRRMKKVVHKGASADDKKLKGSLKRLGVQQLPAIEEVNMFRDDNTVIHFKNPEVQASVRDNLFVISGPNEVKPLRDLMPGIINQLGPQNLEFLKEFVQQTKQETKEDEIPDLVEGENFEEIAAKD